MKLKEDEIELIAAVCHEVNRAYCQSIGDDSQVFWEDAPKWQQDSAMNGVRFAFENDFPSPAEMHDNWSKEKIADGWVYGEKKDPEAKTHHCLVPYDELPEAQRIKDIIFSSVVKAMITLAKEDREEE